MAFEILRREIKEFSKPFCLLQNLALSQYSLPKEVKTICFETYSSSKATLQYFSYPHMMSKPHCLILEVQKCKGICFEILKCRFSICKICFLLHEKSTTQPDPDLLYHLSSFPTRLHLLYKSSSFFIYSLIDFERNIGLLFRLFMHSLVD